MEFRGEEKYIRYSKGNRFGGFKVKIRALSDIGTVRKENQDNYYVGRFMLNGEEVSVACVCDGMGGLADGEVASSMVIDALKGALTSNITQEDIIKALYDANNSVYMLSTFKKKMMGTTCTFICCGRDGYWGVHIGDSRCYQLTSSGLKQLTNDHTALKKYGIEKGDPRYIKYRSKLTKCIGAVQNVTFDRFSGKYEKGRNSFILCSDGFWHYFEESNLSLENKDDLGMAIDYCIEKGETDNITVVVVDVER